MRSLLLASAALAALSTPALAADAPQDAVGVDELVVTATRLPAALDQVTGARVIDRAEIEARQSVLLTDVLATVPGVAVARNGAFGGVAAIRIRGASPDKTLVLLDGVPAGDPSDPTGVFDASNLQLSDVERVEVLSGPQGSLWGSEAIGGVVSITSREFEGLGLSAEAGSFETFRGQLAGGVRTDAYAFGGSISGYRTDGISKADERDGAREDDGFETFAATLTGRINPSDAVTLDGRLRYSETEVDLDGFPAPVYELADTADRSKARTWSGLLRAQIQDVAGLDHSLSVSAYDIDRKSLSAFPSRYTAERQVLRWTGARGGADDAFAFVVGAERSDSTADLDGRDSIDLSAGSVFGVGRLHAGERLTFTGSLRYDDPDRFKGRATARLAAAARLGTGLTLTASAGQGFKIPTISQVICDFCFPAGPSLNLKPERAEGYDLRLGWSADDGRYSAALTGYRLSVRDQIYYGTGRYINIARTRSTGLEAEGEAQITGTLRLKLAYAWMDAIDASTGASLLRVPDHSGAATLFWEDQAWSATFTLRGESSQSDTARDGFSRVSREGFWTADLAGAYALNDQVSFTARIENLADEKYQETFGYGEPGRALYVGVRLRR